MQVVVNSSVEIAPNVFGNTYSQQVTDVIGSYSDSFHTKLGPQTFHCDFWDFLKGNLKNWHNFPDMVRLCAQWIFNCYQSKIGVHKIKKGKKCYRNKVFRCG